MKKIIVIGAGISGLTAGIYARQQGFDVLLLEKNPSVGGLCTGWYRDGHYIDGCIHWLTGTNDGNDVNIMWKNVDALNENVNIIQLNSWGTFEYQGKKVTFWSDLEKAEKEWKEVSPEDKKEIHHFFKMVKDIQSVELPLDMPASILPFKRLLKLGWDVLKVWPSYLITMKKSCEEYTKRFKSPAIKWAITHAQPGAGNLYSMIFCYGTVASGNGGIPEGGSKPMVERMKNKFLSLGGELKLNSDVDHILVDKKKAIGVFLKNGEEYLADYVVSALDVNYTMGTLLQNKYHNKKLDSRFYDYKNHPAPSCCLLEYEINDIELPIPYSFECEPFYCGKDLISHLTIRSRRYDLNTYVKDGKTTLSVLIDQYGESYKYWSHLYRENVQEYKRLKEKLAVVVMNKIIDKIPTFKGNIKILDVATPKTLNRYVNASRGAYMGFLFNKKANMFTHNGEVKGLKNFVMAGQWMQCPGGLPLALSEGKFAIQRICKKEKLSIIFSHKEEPARKKQIK